MYFTVASLQLCYTASHALHSNITCTWLVLNVCFISPTSHVLHCCYCFTCTSWHLITCTTTSHVFHCFFTNLKTTSHILLTIKIVIYPFEVIISNIAIINSDESVHSAIFIRKVFNALLYRYYFAYYLFGPNCYLCSFSTTMFPLATVIWFNVTMFTKVNQKGQILLYQNRLCLFFMETTEFQQLLNN